MTTMLLVMPLQEVLLKRSTEAAKEINVKFYQSMMAGLKNRMAASPKKSLAAGAA